MSHLEEVIARVDAAVTESVIVHMNELLIELSEDTELSREDRYAQQQRLRDRRIGRHGRMLRVRRSARSERRRTPSPGTRTGR